MPAAVEEIAPIASIGTKEGEGMQLTKKYTKDQLFQLAFRDQLTGVYNRNALEEVRAEYECKRIWVSIIDIDNLKQINDHRGHAVGDIVIATVAKQLLTFSPDVVRLGGDEFLMLGEAKPPERIEGATIGTIEKYEGCTMTEAMHYADLVMYYNKEKKKHAKAI